VGATVTSVPIRRLWSRVEPLSDPVIALALIVFGSWDILAHNPGSYPGSAGGHEVFLVLCCAPLAWRRRAPLAVLMVVFGVTLAWVYSMYRLDQQGPFEGFVAIMIAVYTAAAYTSGNEAIATAVVTTVGLLVGVITGGVGGESAGNVIPFTLWVVVAYVIGRVFRRRQLVAAELGDRVSRLEREREQRAQQAVAAERERIARELHDVIAHSVSVMVVQAGAGERVLDGDPEQARAAFYSIRETGSEALEEMRRLLGLLRQKHDALSLAPQPSIARLSLLVDEVRAAGLPTQLAVEGRPKTLAPGIELSAYRIVQEALTNIRKHAGAVSASVRVHYTEHEVVLEVDDNGNGTLETNGDGSGHGLIGMRERAALYGGTLEAGPRTDGGFRIRATLPLEHPSP
jgi:signal transduction histidine kinase